MKAFVIDTNVPVTANGMADHANLDCVEACIEALIQAREAIMVLDDQGLIMAEYRRYLSPSGQPGVGDEFMQWLDQNQWNPEHCERAQISPINGSNEDFREFPNDHALASFDRADRKFVATAKASRNRPVVLNAVDTDWWNFRHDLKRHGVRVNCLCPQCMC